ncbi:hypothetical protein [Risungbinella massiliensis]|uniref:hypothetical protein n=1 Tax=Risungbinella massiliensis TaxID=1329796 RepID=UPI0012B5ED36|nr:hypothetical protein [Risungbinella massiliensis]
MQPIYKQGEKVRVGNRTGVIYDVNKKLEVYQVMFDKWYGELISFEQLERRDKDEKKLH